MIPGYTTVESIDDGSLHVIVRATHDESNESVIIKMLRADDADISHGNRLRREFSVSKLVNQDRIVPVLGLFEHRNSPYLVKRDLGGKSLDRHLQSSPLTEIEILRIACHIAQSIASVHEAGVIHKDVKPANIIVSDERNRAWLTDFDISSHIKREKATDVNLADFGGSLPYVSPEQTGRMNRSVDSRSDLYSLGITLYEMCTGVRPFDSHDPMEVVHGHIARTPTAPIEINTDLSPAVNDIILRLLSKAAEDRYQRAIGVYEDLKTCLHLLESSGKVGNFKLGGADIPVVLQIPEKLYGREREQNALLDAYARISNGAMEVATVFGYSGVGKSSLVNELNKPITKNNGRFVVGKFDQFKRSSPYSALTQALDTVARRMLAESEDVSNTWVANIKAHAGDACAIIPELIPSLTQQFADTSDLLEVGGVEAQQRQRSTLAAVLRATATRQRPLVLFVDDLQWADADTLAFLDYLATNPVEYLYLILSYRDNEAPDNHPLHEVIRGFSNAGVPVSELNLQPLSSAVVHRLIADTVLRDGADVEQLSAAINNKTNGNPFFITQLLQQLHSNDVFGVDSSGRWTWDIVKVSELAITENVVDLLRSRMDTLPADQQKILATAATIGSEFSLGILSKVMGSAHKTAELLWPHVIDGYVTTRGAQTLDDALHDVESIELSLADMYGRFAHDKIREAALELISEDEKLVAHFNISKAYQEFYTADDLDDHLFELAGHVMSSKSLHNTNELLERYIWITRRAGTKAVASSTFDAAAMYFRTAIEAMGSRSWTDHPIDRPQVSLALAHALWLGNRKEELIELLDELDNHITSVEGKVEISTLRRRLAFSVLKIADAIRYAVESLALLGETTPKKPNKLHVVARLAHIHWLMRKHTPQSLAAMPEVTDKRVLKVIDIISEVAEVLYYNDPNLFTLLLLKQMELTLKYGNHHASSAVYIGYGIVRVFAFSDVDRSYDLCRMAMSLPDKFNRRDFRPKNELSYAYMVQHRKEHLDETYKHFFLAFRLGLESGMHADVANGSIGLIYHAMFQGRPLLQTLRDSETYLKTLLGVKQLRNESGQRLYLATLKTMHDVTMPDNINVDGFSADDYATLSLESGDYTSIASCGKNGAYAMLIFERYEEARTYINRAIPYASFLQGTISEMWIPFLDVIIDYMRYTSGRSELRTSVLKRARATKKRIEKWSRLSPENYSHMAYTMHAIIHATSKEYDDAATLFSRSLDAASRAGFVNSEAIISDCAASMCRMIGDQAKALQHETAAYQAYKLWGIPGRIAKFEQKHPEAAVSSESAFGATARTTSFSSSGAHGSLDLGTVMKASHVIAAEIDQERLIGTTLEIMVENAGADRGMLLFNSDGAWAVSALFDVNDREETSTTSFPDSIIGFVDRTRESVVLSNAPMNDTFGDDPYIQTNKPRSVLCLPILHQSKLIGILYLENTLTNGAFTEDRIAILNLLTVQSAISLENAALYQNLEQKVEERTAELQRANELLDVERQKSEQLLLNVLPAGIVDRLKQGETNIADRSSNVSVLFADIANFTRLSSERSPEEVVKILNNVFNTFDELVANAGLEKIKTIGDAYMVVSGLPEPREDQAEAMALLAKEMQNVMPGFARQLGVADLGIRIGIHTGPVVAGVIGKSKFSYDIWGDTVNLAARMESHGMVGKVHVSGEFVSVLRAQSSREWITTERKDVEVKGKGKLTTYWLE